MAMQNSHGLDLLGSDAASFLARAHRNLIGDRWQDAGSGDRMDIVDPATGAVIGSLAIEQGPWGRVSGSDRARL